MITNRPTKASCDELNPLTFKFISTNEIIPIYSRKFIQLQKDFRKKSFSSNDVHLMRVNIRSFRIFLSLLKELDVSTEYIELSKILRNAFKSLEKSRKLTVFSKYLLAYDVDNKYIKSITKEIQSENKKASESLTSSSLALKVLFENFELGQINASALQNAFDKRVQNYIKHLEIIDLNSVDSIHNLRIKGKMFKYLIDDGILKIQSAKKQQVSDYQLISDLHSCMGNLHDLDENEVLFTKYFINGKNHISKKNTKIILQSFSKNRKAETKHLKTLIFHMRNRLNI